MTDFKIFNYNKESGQYLYARYEDGSIQDYGWILSRPDFAKNGDPKEKWDDAIISYQKDHPKDFPKSKAARDIEKLEAWIESPADWSKASTSQDSCEENEKGEIDQPKEKVKKQMAEMKSDIIVQAKSALDPKNLTKALTLPIIETVKPLVTKVDREYAITHEKTERLNSKELSGEESDETSDEEKDGIGTVMTSKFLGRMTGLVSQKDQISEDNVKSTIKQGKELAKSKYMSSKEKKEWAAIITSAISLLAALAAGMIIGHMLDEKEKTAEEESLESLRADQQKINEKLESEESESSVMRKARSKTDNLSLDKSEDENADEKSTEGNDKKLLIPDNCSISLCVPDNDTDISKTYESTASEGIILEIKGENGAFTINTGQKVKAGDIIGSIDGAPIRSQSDFTVTEKKENYIIGRYDL